MTGGYVENFSDLPEDVQIYLGSNRMCLFSPGEYSELADLIYVSKVQFCHKIAQENGLYLNFFRVYSDSCKSEAISFIEDGYNLIVHDQFLGQVFNMFNRILFYSCGPETCLIYAHKFASFNLCRFGHFNEAAFCADFYRNNKHSMDVYRRQINMGMIIHSVSTNIQESFIILHELGHLVKRRSPHMLMDIEAAVDSGLRAYFDKHQVYLMGDGRNVDKLYRSDSARFELFKNFQDGVKNLSQIAFRAIEEVGYFEELVCDIFAVNELIKHPVELAGFNFIDKDRDGNGSENHGDLSGKITFFVGVVTALLHLRTMQVVQSTISSHSILFNSDIQQNGSFFDPIVYFLNHTRVHFVKDYLLDRLFTADEFGEALDNISSLMDDHSDRIFGPCTKIVNNFLYNGTFRKKYIEGLDGILPLDEIEARTVVTALWQMGSENTSKDLDEINLLQKSFMERFRNLNKMNIIQRKDKNEEKFSD